jgi:uncharacterized membrane protein YkvA (DUF1232 family)
MMRKDGGMDWKARAKKLKTELPAIYIAMHKKETPMAAKILAVVIVAYALSPIDIIPDFIPVLGLLDDLILLPILVALLIKMIPADLMNRCRIEAEGLGADKKPQKWGYAIPVVILWVGGLLLLWLLFRVAT